MKQQDKNAVGLFLLPCFNIHFIPQVKFFHDNHTVSHKKVTVLHIEGTYLTLRFMRDDCDLGFAMLEIVF